MTKSFVGLVVLRKARVSKSKQTDGGSLGKIFPPCVHDQISVSFYSKYGAGNLEPDNSFFPKILAV